MKKQAMGKAPMKHEGMKKHMDGKVKNHLAGHGPSVHHEGKLYSHSEHHEGASEHMGMKKQKKGY